MISMVKQYWDLRELHAPLQNALRIAEGKAFPSGDMVQSPPLKLNFDLRADLFRDTPRGTGIQLRGRVIRVEGIDAEFS